MSTLSTSIDVSRSPKEVFDYVTDPARFGEWQANVTGGHSVGSEPPQAGARCVTTRRIGFATRDVAPGRTPSRHRGGLLRVRP
jgi:hypothetical protein